MAKGLVSWWPFNEGGGSEVLAYGEGGSALNGGSSTLINADTAGASWVGNSSPLGGALFFDGIDDRLQSSPFKWPYVGTVGGPISIAFWVWVNNVSQINGCFGIGLQGNPNRCNIQCPSTDGNLYWDYGDSTGNGRITTSFSGFLGQWTHVCVTSEGNSGTYKSIMINGRTRNSAAVSDGPDIQLTTLTIGHENHSSGSSHFRGFMDDVRVYNRVLTENEVTDIINTPYAHVISSGWRSAWFANGGSGPTPGHSYQHQDSSMGIRGYKRSWVA